MPPLGRCMQAVTRTAPDAQGALTDDFVGFVLALKQA